MTQLHLPPVYRGQELYEQRSQSLPWHLTDAGIPDHWEHCRHGEGVLVGVADTGIDPNHPDCAERIDHTSAFAETRYRREPDYFDGNGHGTHVLTTIAVGAPKCRFAVAKVLADNGSGYNRDVAEGIKWLADRGCHVINVSLGGPFDDPLTREAMFYAKNKGSIMCCATGNEAASSVGYPAKHGIGVGALARNRRLAWFSNRGSHVDITAYGVDIVAGVPGGRWQAMSGTSMAAPNFAIVATLRLGAELKHLGEIYTNSDERALELETFVTDLGPEGRDTSYGRGMADLPKCLYQNLSPQPAEPEDGTFDCRIEEVGGRERVWIGTLQPERIRNT